MEGPCQVLQLAGDLAVVSMLVSDTYVCCELLKLVWKAQHCSVCKLMSQNSGSCQNTARIWLVPSQLQWLSRNMRQFH